MVAVQPLVSEFTIVGKLVDFEDFVVGSKASIKYLYLSTSEEEYTIKVAKEQKRLLSKYLKPGCWLKVTGMRKYDLHQEKIEYKAYRIELLPAQACDKTTSNAVVETAQPKVKVLICQGSSCYKNGGKALWELLRTDLQGTRIKDKVETRITGCLKQCKQAPNLVVMPGKNIYGRVQPKQLSKLVAQHLR
jgi:NADH:ubiquinone oxidoreductase subunit E